MLAIAWDIKNLSPSKSGFRIICCECIIKHRFWWENIPLKTKIPHSSGSVTERSWRLLCIVATKMCLRSTEMLQAKSNLKKRTWCFEADKHVMAKNDDTFAMLRYFWHNLQMTSNNVFVGLLNIMWPLVKASLLAR